MTFHDAAQQVLEHRKFDAIMGRAIDFRRLISSIIEAIIKWITEHIHLNMPNMPHYNTGLFSKIFIGLGIVAFIVLVVVFISMIKRRKKTTQTMEEIFEQLKNKHITFSDLITTSDQFAAQNDFRQAMRHRFIGVVWLLNQQSLLHLDYAKTNNQLKRDIARVAPALSASFGDIVSVFNHVWFGHKTMSIDAYQDFVAHVDTFIVDVRSTQPVQTVQGGVKP